MKTTVKALCAIAAGAVVQAGMAEALAAAARHDPEYAASRQPTSIVPSQR